jgi:hypothetical protein
MNYRGLLEKYNLLVKEVDRLSEENRRLKAELGEIQTDIDTCKNDIIDKQSILDEKQTDTSPLPEINNKSDSTLKIKLFMSLFKGRDDVYAKRWENKNKTKSGYSSVCLNQWQAGSMIMWMSMSRCSRKCITDALAVIPPWDTRQRVKTLSQRH